MVQDVFNLPVSVTENGQVRIVPTKEGILPGTCISSRVG